MYNFAVVSYVKVKINSEKPQQSHKMYLLKYMQYFDPSSHLIYFNTLLPLLLQSDVYSNPMGIEQMKALMKIIKGYVRNQ